MTDFGTMSVTRSLSISTRNPSTTSGIPHFQSGFGTFYGSMPLKDHDLTSMTYPGFYGNHSGEFFPSQPVTNGLSINSMTPGSATCHQQQFQQQQQQQQHNQQHHHHHQQQQQQQQYQQHHQQQQQNKRRGEWITFSKPFLLKLVEKLCQLSFETEVVPSPALEVNSQGGVADQKVKADQSSVNSLTGNPSVSLSETTNNGSNYSPSISLATNASTTATTTPLVNVQTSNDKINNNNSSNNNSNSSSSGVCSRKSRQKSRPVKFVRPFESSEERQKSEDSDINVESDDDDDNDDTTMKKNINKSSSSSSSSNSNAISAIVSLTSVNPTCVAVTTNSSSAVTVVVGKNKENLKRERDACEDSETEHVNVEDDDDDGGDANAPTAKTKTTDHPGSENIHCREGPPKDQSILERSFQSAKLHFNPGSSSAPPPPPPHHHHHLINPLWSEYFKLNFGLQPTYQPAFNSQKGASQAEPSRQSWAAFNKSLVYKMFDEVLDNDKTHNSTANYQPSAQPAQSSLHDARFLFASHRPGHLGLHLSNGLDKHLGTYDVAFCQGRMGQVRDSHDDDRENKRTSIGQVRNKRLRDGFARGRHQLINRRNKARNSCATKGTCPRNSGLEKEQSERSNCKDTNPVCDVPILGALLSSNDTKLYSSHRSVHYSVNNNNNSNHNNSNKNVKVCSEQQHNTILKPTTANNNNNNASPISCDIPMKNGLHQNPSTGKVEGWPKWVALDKGQVKSLVDSLVATMMGTGDGQSPSSCHSMTPPPPKSRDDDSEMQVDGNSNDESSPPPQQQQQQTATSSGNTVEDDIKESADVNHATSSNSSGTSTYQSPQSSPKYCGIEIERSAPPHNSNNNNNNNENSSSSSNRDSETETNFSGDTQLDQSDLDECSGRQVEEDMSDDGESSARDADTDDCARMECHSTHRRCPIKWKSNMLKRMKAEKRRPET